MWLALGLLLCFFSACNGFLVLTEEPSETRVGYVVFVVLFLVTGAPLTVYGARRIGGRSATCPWCAEHVRPAAKVCRFCGREIPEPPPPIAK